MQSDIESIYNALIEQASPKYAPVKRRFQRIYDIVLFSIFIAILALALVDRLIGHTASSDEKLILALIIQLTCFFMVIEPMVESVIRFRSLPQNLLRYSSERAKVDYEISAGLAGLPGFMHELEFVAKRLRSDVDRIRLRVNTLVGPIDKLGGLPLLASIVFTGWLKWSDPTRQNVPESWIGWIVGCVIGYFLLYFLSLNGMWRLHRFEELAQIAELAVEIKKQSETDAASQSAASPDTATITGHFED